MDIELIRRLSELPYLPSPEGVIRLGLKLARPRENDIFVDLGCGDGRILMYVAKNYGIYCVGFELNPILVKIAKREIRSSNLGRFIDIIFGDFFYADFSKFTIIYSYPSPTIIRRLSLKILNECKQGCRIITHDHPLEGLKPVTEVCIPSGSIHIHKIYLYTI